MHASRSWINRIPRAGLAPTVSEIVDLLERAADELPLGQVWVNPDCGLKKRGYPETVAALQNLVEATRRVRDRASISV